MKEIIFLSFGNNSNYVLTHFFNLNDEILKDKSNPLNLNHYSIYNDSYRPRVILFDYSPNIQKYYTLNENISQNYIDSIKSQYSEEKLQVYQTDLNQNNFLSMMSELNLIDTNIYDDNEKNEEEEEEEDEEDNKYNYLYYYKKKKKKDIKKKNKINDIEEPKKEMSEKLEGLLNLNDNELYEYFNFNKSIKNWNDYLQIKLPSNCFQDIKIVDVDERIITSYIRGKDFFNIVYNKTNYFEDFEDSFRKKLEECDTLSCLHINIDMNSFWGGIGVCMLENISDMINKVPKVLNSYDYNSLFYIKNKFTDNENLFDIEKFTNYIWFLSDLQDIEGSNILFNINYLNETKDIIKDYFGYDCPNIFNEKNNNNIFYNSENNKRNIGTTNLDSIDPTYKYYYSALSSLQLQTFYLPLRSTLYGKNSYIQNLNITSNENSINFMESDLIFNIDNINNNLTLESNGTFYNPCRNIKNNKFKWDSIFNKSIYLNNYNSSILIGNENNYKLMKEQIPNYLHKMSKIVFSLNENYPIPISFPRKFYKKTNFQGGVFEYKNKIPLYINNRPYFDFCLKSLGNFKKDHKTYELSAKKLLDKIDKDKSISYQDKVESIFNMIYVYKDLAEEKLNEFDDEESDEEPDI